MKIDVYEVIEGSDDWPIVDTIEAETADECDEIAFQLYGQDKYHWTLPV